MAQITTITFFRYSSFFSKLWAFGMMQFAHGPLSKVGGLQTYKLMGTGKDGFNPCADWSVYVLLQIWDDEETAQRFFETSSLMERYRSKSSELYTLFLRNIKSKGEWSGKNPFEKSEFFDKTNSFIAVITRATIKKRLLFKFWKYVPTSQKPLQNNEGLIYTKGIGEVPFLQMATFSIWRDKESLMQFAYGSKEHVKAIAETKRLDWYKEELFARFVQMKINETVA
jgi:heme-degrading monooxygenase HmoA